jgi:uncharacterized protein with PQ loop repeat
LNDLAVILSGLALIGIEIARSLPAYLRVKRSHSSDGISATSLGVLAGTGAAWIILAVTVHAWWILIANVLWFTFHMMLCTEVSKTDPSKRQPLIVSTVSSIAGLALAVLLASFFVSMEKSLSIMLGISVVFYALPALYEGLRSATTRGLSLIALSVNSIEGIIYLLAGLSVISLAAGNEPVLGFIIFGVVSAISNGARLVRVAYRRARGLDAAIVE